MRKLFILFMFAIVILSTVVLSANTAYSEISATLLSQTPDPVEPGQVVKVKFKIENDGVQTAKDVIVKLLPNSPFSIYNDVDEKNIGKLKASSTGADAAVVEFRIKVDEQAVEGETELELMVQIGEAAISYTNDDFMIDIQTHDAVLDITSITYEPEQIAPGENAEIYVQVKNLADSLLKDVKFKLDLSDPMLPLAPYQSSSERRISQLKSNYQSSLSFNIIADPEATPGLFKVPLNITYNDEKGNSYSVDDVLAITVGEKPKIKAYVKKSTVHKTKEEGTITLEIANSGSSDIKYLEMYVLDSEDYELISTTDYYYLGDVDSDDTESEEIDVYVNKKVKTLHLPLMLKYYDANNKPYQQQFDLEMPLYSSSELKRFGLVESGNGWTYIIIILLGIGGYVYYRRYKKKKDNK
jgi:hypothetical protein